MHRHLLGQLRHRTSRTLALLLGILVATTSFTVLTRTAQTSRLETEGTVTRNFRAAYDILVRPHTARPVQRPLSLLRRQPRLFREFAGERGG